MKRHERQQAGLGITPIRDRRSPERGFSLIEMIVVIAIMAVLAGVAVPTVDLLQTRARSNRTVDQMEALETAFGEYFRDHFVYPTVLNDLEAEGYVNSPFGAGDAFLDGWGNGFTYRSTGVTATLTSLGPDQVDSAANIVLALDGQRLLRTETRKNMDTLHLALQQYQVDRVPLGLPDLPPVWYDPNPSACALGILVSQGYLANDTRYRTDAWGADFNYGGSPNVHVVSGNM